MVGAWLASKAPTLKATIRASYRPLLDVCIFPTWERVPLSGVTHADVAAWVAQLAGEVGPSRCRKSATLLSGILASAVRDQRLSRNPCEGVSLPRLPEQRQWFLTLVQLNALDVEASDYRLFVMASVSEVAGRQVWSTPKNHQSREVPVPRSLMAELGSDSRRPGAWRAGLPESERRCDPECQLAASGRAGAIRRTGLAGLRPHDLRHTAASLAITSGASVKHVQRMLAHKDAALMLNVHASLFVDERRPLTVTAVDQAICRAPPAGCEPATRGLGMRAGRPRGRRGVDPHAQAVPQRFALPRGSSRDYRTSCGLCAAWPR